jgi:hemoglobin
MPISREIPVNLPALKAIYTKVGGEEGLRKILQDFYQRMSKDILIGFFFDGKDLTHIAEMQMKFLMRAMGATPTYSGKAPAQAHTELPKILSGHFDRRLRILEETLRAHGLAEPEVQTWIAFENAFRDSIVQPEGPRS